MMFESPHSLWQHFAVAIVAVLVIMSLSSVNANNENDQCMLSGKTRTEKPCTGRLYRLSEALSRVAGLPVNSHVCRRHWDELRRGDVRCSCPTHDRKTPSRLDSRPIPRRFIEDITRWREDMNFIFEWQEQYLTRSLRSPVRYCFCHESIKFISSSQRVMFFILYGD